MLSERRLTDALLPALQGEMPQAVILKHADRFRSGVPDISVDFVTTGWLEVKATEREESLETMKGIQLLTARKIYNVTHRCWFVVYKEFKTPREVAGFLTTKEVAVYTPRQVSIEGYLKLSEARFAGFDHSRVAAWIRQKLTERMTTSGSIPGVR